MLGAPTQSRLNLSGLLVALNICLALSATYVWYINLYYAPVNPDAGYYLSVAEKLRNGSLLYQDIRFHYTPLGEWFIAFSGALAPSEAVSYEWYLAAQIICLLICSALIGKILLRAQISAGISFLTSLLFLLTCSLYQGNLIVLEPITLIFVLLAFLSAQRGNAFLAGICASSGVLCKLYAIAILPAIFVLLINYRKEKSVQLVLNMALGALLAVLCVASWLVLHDNVSIATLLKSWLHTGYEVRYQQWSSALEFLFLYASALLILPLALFKWGVRFRPIILAVTLASIGFSCQLLIRQYDHYFLLILPFTLMLLTLLTNAVAASCSSKGLSRLCLGVWILAVFSAWGQSMLLARGWVAANLRSAQYASANELKNLLQPADRVLLMANPNLFFLAQIEPFNIKEEGFYYMTAYPAQQIIDFSKQANVIITAPSDSFFYQSVAARISAELGSEEFSPELLGFSLRAKTNTGLFIWTSNLTDRLQ